MNYKPKSFEGRWSTIDIDINELWLVHRKMIAGHVAYGYSIKAPSLDCQVSQIKSIDCSGDVRFLLAKASDQHVIIVDGSQNQWAQIRESAFKESTFEAGFADDGALRVAFLAAADGHAGIGHVLLIEDGMTLESRGGHGASTQRWGAQPYHRKMHVYLLTAPTK